MGGYKNWPKTRGGGKKFRLRRGRARKCFDFRKIYSTPLEHFLTIPYAKHNPEKNSLHTPYKIELKTKTTLLQLGHTKLMSISCFETDIITCEKNSRLHDFTPSLCENALSDIVLLHAFLPLLSWFFHRD